MSDFRPSKSYLVQQICIQRKNLFAACSATIKCLLDKASHESVEEDSPEVLNFCAVLEHILLHRIKPLPRWYGQNEHRWYWDFIRTVCDRVPHSCLSSIETMEKPKSARGKGRAWIRMALMEKRLSEYLSTALEQTKLTRSFYMDGSFMLSEDMQAITGMILGLNVIDFRFDVKSDNLDFITLPVVDYSAFMKYVQRNDNIAESSVADADGNMGNLQGEFWKQKHNQLANECKTVAEQKGYLEELVRVREGQLEEVQFQRQKVIETLHHYESESRRERQQLENVIIELQAQIMELNDINKVQQTQIQILEKQHDLNPPIIAMSDLVHLEDERDIEHKALQYAVASAASNSCELLVPQSPYKIPTPHPDAKPITGSSAVYAIAKEDTQSMIVLAGSYSSDSGVHSAEARQSESQTVTSNRSPQHITSLKPEPAPKGIKAGVSDVNAAPTEMQPVEPPRQPKPDLVAACQDPKSKSGKQDILTAAQRDSSRVEDDVAGDYNEKKKTPALLPMVQSIIIEGEADESDS